MMRPRISPRSQLLCISRNCLSRNRHKITPNPVRRRFFSGSGTSNASWSDPAGINALMSQLDLISPKFFLDKDDVTIVDHPKEFHHLLLKKIRSAKKRIFLATLYIGSKQHELIEALRHALQENPDLQVDILIDCLRGTRGLPGFCSASLVVPLVCEFGDRVRFRMFHTPNLRGLRKKLIPQRLNEGWGLQHMKLYGFDDEIMLSGANLSQDYFSNRQDRYYIFSDCQLTDYYKSIYDAVASLSFLVSPSTKKPIDEYDPPGFVLVWPESNKAADPLSDTNEFKRQATKRLAPLLLPRALDEKKSHDEKSTTVVYPISQLTPLLDPNTSTEHPALVKLFEFIKATSHKEPVSWTVTAGYFNIHPDYKKLLLESRPKMGTIITAAPEANGFYKSSGISRYLPDAYLLHAQNFLKEVLNAKKENLIQVYEWKRGIVNQPGGWSYHAKGVWVKLKDEENPSITIIGSSNYTRRSHALDLETNALIITRDEILKQAMEKEVINLELHCSKLQDQDNDERKIGMGVKLAAWILGGKL